MREQWGKIRKPWAVLLWGIFEGLNCLSDCGFKYDSKD
jgi:hypothetical protein